MAAASRAWILQQQRDSLTAADAGGCDSKTSAGTLQFASESKGQPYAGRTEGMANCNRAAVHFQLGTVQSQFALACEHLGREGFVDFKTVDLLQVQPRKVEKALNGGNRTDSHHLGWNTDYSSRHYLCQSRLFVAARIVAGSDQRSSCSVHDVQAFSSGLHSTERRFELR